MKPTLATLSDVLGLRPRPGAEQEKVDRKTAQAWAAMLEAGLGAATPFIVVGDRLVDGSRRVLVLDRLGAPRNATVVVVYADAEEILKNAKILARLESVKPSGMLWGVDEDLYMRTYNAAVAVGLDVDVAVQLLVARCARAASIKSASMWAKENLPTALRCIEEPDTAWLAAAKALMERMGRRRMDRSVLKVLAEAEGGGGGAGEPPASARGVRTRRV